MRLIKRDTFSARVYLSISSLDNVSCARHVYALRLARRKIFSQGFLLPSLRHRNIQFQNAHHNRLIIEYI